MGVMAIAAFRRKIHSHLALRVVFAFLCLLLVAGSVTSFYFLRLDRVGRAKLEPAGKHGPQPASTTPEQLRSIGAQEQRGFHGATSSAQRVGRSGLAYFAGTWKNPDANTKGLTTLRVRTEGESVWVHAWEKCHPTDCDWGEVHASPMTAPTSVDPTSEAEKVTALFQTSFSDTVMTLSPSDDDALEAETQTRFTDNSGRLSYSSTYTLRH